MIIEGFGFKRIFQKGSHVKLRRLGPGREKQTLIIPLDEELSTGTCQAIYRQACQYIKAEELYLHFYS